jgi:predicted nucleic acid-binding protein
MDYVFDASFVGAKIIPDEKNPRINIIGYSIANDETIFVPQLLWYEIANIFNNLVLRKRYTYDETARFVPLLQALRLTTDYETGADYSAHILRIARDYALSAYDAAYLELAGRKKAVLCTLDGSLQKAAKKYGVTVMK